MDKELRATLLFLLGMNIFIFIMTSFDGRVIIFFLVMDLFMLLALVGVFADPIIR